MRTAAAAFFLLSLVVLLGTPFADASTQEDQLRNFIASRAPRRLANRHTGNDGPDVTDNPWADPGSSFAHLPERCKIPRRGSKEADRVERLPGQPPRVNFAQYAGYVTVNEEHGRELFYYFAESPYDAASKPLILWLNGGPGCSSLGYGAMEELGPFRVNRDGKTLRRNKHAWNNLANVIFLESPAGVGFSFSRNVTDYETPGDRRTAEDAYVFLVKWLERFPEYKGRDFYVAGESYGGHYVPELATVITAMNGFPGHQQIRINLQGIFVGNPYLDYFLYYKGYYEFMWSHGVISDEVWEKILAKCNFNEDDDWTCFVPQHWFQPGAIYGYDIYAPVCLQSSNGTHYPSGYLPDYDPCIDHYVQTYLNNLEVQTALHARIKTNFSICHYDMSKAWNIEDRAVPMVPIIKSLVDHGLRVWIYSGDFDSVCSITATRYSVKELNLTVTKKWRPWYTPDIEVGGYVQQYQGGFTLASVRGAGHMVPSFQPKRSLVLLYSFLKNMLPPAGDPN